MGAAPRPLNIWGVWGSNPQIRVLTKQLTAKLELLKQELKTTLEMMMPNELANDRSIRNRVLYY
jgi:hypothetical protein